MSFGQLRDYGLHFTIYNALSVEHGGVGAFVFYPGFFGGLGRGALVWASIVN